MKNQYRGGDCLKRVDSRQFANLREGGGGLGKKKVVVFLRQRWNFSSKAIGKIIAEVEAKKHYLPRQCLGNFFADIIE